MYGRRTSDSKEHTASLFTMQKSQLKEVEYFSEVTKVTNQLLTTRISRDLEFLQPYF